MATEAHRERNRRHKQKLDQIVITVPKGAREKIRAHAEKREKSVNRYVVELIEKDMDCSIRCLVNEE